MVNEIIKTLIDNKFNLHKKPTFIDATIGLGGHSKCIQKQFSNFDIIGYDRDFEAINIVKSKFKNIKLINKTYDQIDVKADCILFDLGVSSMQIDNYGRGFSYMHSGPLDMRMDKTQALSAKTIVNTYSKSKLAYIIKNYGDELFANLIAKNIVEYRNKKSIETTGQLDEIIVNSLPAKIKIKRKSGFSKKTFQGIRIEVNNELNILSKAINNSINMLNKNGILIVLSYQSLEDKIVKKIFNEYGTQKFLKNVPISINNPILKVLKKKKPTELEIQNNSRAKSAIMRVAIKKSNKTI
jgi:16S rRNA (cytosine1402-N4)-methyltransferase